MPQESSKHGPERVEHWVHPDPGVPDVTLRFTEAGIEVQGLPGPDNVPFMRRREPTEAEVLDARLSERNVLDMSHCAPPSVPDNARVCQTCQADTPRWVKPIPGSANWRSDPSPFWQCDGCGASLAFGPPDLSYDVMKKSPWAGAPGEPPQAEALRELLDSIGFANADHLRRAEPGRHSGHEPEKTSDNSDEDTGWDLEQEIREWEEDPIGFADTYGYVPTDDLPADDPRHGMRIFIEGYDNDYNPIENDHEDEELVLNPAAEPAVPAARDDKSRVAPEVGGLFRTNTLIPQEYDTSIAPGVLVEVLVNYAVGGSDVRVVGTGQEFFCPWGNLLPEIG